MNRFVGLMLAIAGALGSVGCAEAADAKPVYIALDDSATQLREDFNRAKGSVRLLFVVDPICPGCLRGLDDVNDALLSETSDPRLQTFVVHVPYLGAKAKDVGPATKVLHKANVRHYWNESGAFGGLLSNAVNLSEGAKKWVYAWDVWLIYGPDATWEGDAPPQPKLLMHQLWALQGTTRYPKFDSKVFAREVHALLAQAPPASNTQ
jgi:hypothetical protein